jgi:hypothetical protein
MKSIMEEASSISKAIDQAWNRAGKPTEFTVKILETPERNLFGLTTKSAKIALFFDEQKIAVKLTTPVEKIVTEKSISRPEPSQQRTTAISQPSSSRWNNEMITMAKDWVQEALRIIGLPHVSFTTFTSMNGLTFRFKNSLTSNEMKDRLLFSSFAHLILTALRQKYKRAFKNLKIILIIE